MSRKSSNAQPKCVHCSEAHSANYRGCMIAKEIQKLRNKNLNKSNKIYKRPNDSKNQTMGKTVQITPVQVMSGNGTYATVVENDKCDPEKYSDDINIKRTLQDILIKLTEFDERFRKVKKSIRGINPKQKKRNDQYWHGMPMDC